MESVLLVPLRSNGSALLSGRPVEAVRRRLKLASLSFDRLYLEDGTYRVRAEPGGSRGWSGAQEDGKSARWQTPARRGAEQRQSLAGAAGRETAPGIPARRSGTGGRTGMPVSWAATLRPFAAELPAGADWVSFVPTRDPDDGTGRASERWRRADERNAVLERAIPERFVRSAVIENADRDLGFAAQYGLAVSADPFHAKVIAERFRAESGWKLRGLALPLPSPDVSDWDWEDVAALRRDRYMTRFRAILREAGQEAAADASGGDVEAAVRRAYRRHLIGALDAVAGTGAAAHTVLQGFVIGGVPGFAVTGLTSPVGIAAGAALGIAPGAILNVRDMTQRRQSRGWITLRQHVDGRFTPGG